MKGWILSHCKKSGKKVWVFVWNSFRYCYVRKPTFGRIPNDLLHTLPKAFFAGFLFAYNGSPTGVRPTFRLLNKSTQTERSASSNESFFKCAERNELTRIDCLKNQIRIRASQIIAAKMTQCLIEIPTNLMEIDEYTLSISIFKLNPIRTISSHAVMSSSEHRTVFCSDCWKEPPEVKIPIIHSVKLTNLQDYHRWSRKGFQEGKATFWKLWGDNFEMVQSPLGNSYNWPNFQQKQ